MEQDGQQSTGVGKTASQFADFDSSFETAGGGQLARWRLAYETYGKLNKDKSNAALVCHALSGHQHAAGVDAQGRAGWWDNMIGPGRALDTDKFFVVSVNNLGGCHGSTGPSSANPETGRAYGSAFPQVGVEDWVRAQAMLADRLGIEKFAAIVGGSLGGMQALQWAIDFPDRVGAAVLAAAAAKLSASNIAFNEIARQAILRDPDFHGGDYYQHSAQPRRGLGVARMLGHVTYLSDAAMAAKFGRRRRAAAPSAYDIEFEVESYLRYQGGKFSDGFDANTYLLMTKALDRFDPAGGEEGRLAEALAAARARFLVIAFSSDWRFAAQRSRELTAALAANGADVSYAEIQSEAGHDAFLMPDAQYHGVVRDFLNTLL